jgi:FlaA1/EpsC-like NDP-sugar epimerase
MLNLLNKLLSISRFYKQIIIIFCDIFLLIFSILASFSIRLGYLYWPQNDLIMVVFGAPLFAIPIFISFGLYRDIIRFIGLQALWKVSKAVFLYSLLWSLICFIYITSSQFANVQGIPRSVIVLNILLSLLMVAGFRVFGRWILTKCLNLLTSFISKNVIIYGAGEAGRQLSHSLVETNEFNLVGFLDDDVSIQKNSINGKNIYSRLEFSELIHNLNITEVFLALPSLSINIRREIIDFLEPFSVHVRSLPSMLDLVRGNIRISDLNEIGIDDLLGRDKVIANNELLNLNILNKVVLVTGAGGSIGSELCRQIILLKPKTLILYELSEFALYQIDKELNNGNFGKVVIFPILGSVNNQKRLSQVFTKFNVDTIYHAAAYKHVPIVEFNNTEGITNNILGTYNCALAAIESSVETFVLISTDKAVRPTNTMGATKRFAELILQSLADHQDNLNLNFNQKISNHTQLSSKTRFMMVRFGNVLGSSGSVIPLFMEQIKSGGPVTVTHGEMQRYFMTISEAVQLVIQAGSMGIGGDVFVLDMGKPVSILALAKKMIRLSGLEVKSQDNPNGDIEIIFSGLRPGEKLYEELLIGKNVSNTENPMIMRAKEKMLPLIELEAIINELKVAINNNEIDTMRKLLIKAVPEFKPQTDIKDILFKDCDSK